jgi:DNA gyrase/topoisomerase IV subunit B
MSDLKKYSEDNIQSLEFYDHIRKRPGMYLGQVNHKGFIDTLKKFITQFIKVSGSNTVKIHFKDNNEGEITFTDIKNPIRQDVAILNKDDLQSTLDLPILNSLCKNMNINFDMDAKLNQSFISGKSWEKYSNKLINCKQLKIEYKLDNEIWSQEFQWNTNYLSYELREFCYLNPNVKFEISETKGKYSNTNTYQFNKGLSDRLEIEILNAIGTCYFRHHVIFKTENFEIEIAFAFRQYTVDQKFIRTYVNNEITPEDGSHLDGLLKGLTYGVMKYFQANNLTNDYKISEKGMKEGLVCIINIKMENAIYSGCVKNKLANSEIIEPIAKHISEELYKSIKNDNESTQKLIDKFKIGKV